MGKYSLEIVDPTSKVLADLSGRATSRHIIVSRNEADQISWRLDLAEFEAWCRATNQDPRLVLKLGSSEVRIKRQGKYLPSAGQLVYKTTHLDANNQYVDVRAEGFLNLLADRNTADNVVYTATEKTTIAAGLINTTQALTNGDFGITIGPVQATVGVADRTYLRTNLKDAIQAFGDLRTASFDHQFTYDKKFNTYASLGSQRPDVVFAFPGNIKSFDDPEDATGLANEITALGSGIGAAAVVVIVASDLASQTDVKLRQKNVQSNGTDNSDGGVTNEANTQLATWSRPIEVPTMIVDGNQGVPFGDYWVGDYVRVKVSGHKSLEHVNGMFRIEKLDLSIDAEDNEEVRVYVV